jgi:hypothetical protein
VPAHLVRLGLSSIILGGLAVLPVDQWGNRLFPDWKRQNLLDTVELI